MTVITAAAAWAEGIAHLVTESGGMLEVAVMRPPDVLTLFATRVGNPEAMRLVEAVTAFLERVSAAEPVLCATCDTILSASTAFSLVVALPSRADPAQGIALGMCATCAIDPDEIMRRAMVLRGRCFWPSPC